MHRVVPYQDDELDMVASRVSMRNQTFGMLGGIGFCLESYLKLYSLFPPRNLWEQFFFQDHIRAAIWFCTQLVGILLKERELQIVCYH